MTPHATSAGPAAVGATLARRLAFIAYATALSVGTHWPRLQLGDPTRPPDKLLHYGAFAGLAFFLWQARYFRRHVTLLLVGVAWACLDELTQQAPGLERSFSYQDIAASSLGVLSATAVLWSLRPRPPRVGSPLAAVRDARRTAILDLVLARPAACAVLLASASSGALIGIVLGLVASAFLTDIAPFQSMCIGGGLGGAALAGATLIVLMRSAEAKLMAGALCPRCGGTNLDVAGRCASCDRVLQPVDRIELPFLTWPDVLRASLRPTVLALAMLLALFCVWVTLLVLRPTFPVVASLEGWVRSWESGILLVADATVVALLAAAAVDRVSARMARRLAESDRTCLRCGHDLRGTPARSGIGACGECGVAFLRQDAS